MPSLGFRSLSPATLEAARSPRAKSSKTASATSGESSVRKWTPAVDGRGVDFEIVPGVS